jgi:hydrophobic/amphiphilic exporter-1 (mainly G- bacteria), HAE1 family
MSIYKTAVNKPITTIMIFTAVIVMGLYSLIYIPIDLYPEMDPPFISVMTTYTGANAGDIEINVTRRLEDAFNTVDNLKQITSVSSDNLSVISMEFDWDTDLNEATNDIRDAIDLLFDYLPEGVNRPSIFKFNLSMIPIVFYAITAGESYKGLEKILEEKIINPLNRIEGIGSVSLIGTPRRRIYVDVDPVRLEGRNITLEQVGNVVTAANMNMPSGNIKMGLANYQLRVEGEIAESAELNNLVVGYHGGAAVFLRDVAHVRDTLSDLSLDERITNQQGVRMFVLKQSGANTVKIARAVRSAITELEKDLPPDIEIKEILDTSVFISDAVGNLSKTMMWALFFVVLVVLFFLGKWRATFIIVITIPVSLIVSFIYLYITGSSLNVISLASLSIALGMVVDDAIVVLENISRHVERGSSPREAAIYATNEVWLSVVVTTMVVVAVFFPLTLVGGMTGVLFRQLGWIVTITVVTSTLAAISLTPMLASKLLSLKNRARSERRFSHSRTIQPFLAKIETGYERTIYYALRNKLMVVIASLAVFIVSLFLLKFIGTDFLPEADESRINATVELTTGLRVEETIKVAREIEQMIVDRVPEAEVWFVSSGSDDSGGMMALFFQGGSNMINMGMRLRAVADRSRSVWEIADDMRRQMELIPEIVEFSVTTGGGGFGSTTVDVEIFGYDFNVTSGLAEKVREGIRAIPGAEDVQISRKNDRPELQIVLDKSKLATHGLNTAMVSSAIRNRVEGITASLFREEGEEYSIIVRYAEEFRNSISGLEAFSITSPMGMTVSLGELGKVQEFWNPPNVERKRRERVVTVSAIPAGIPLGDLAAEIRNVVNSIEIPQGVMINVGGAYEEQIESFMDLGLLLLISLILVFLVMASQFESFIMPFVIMFSIPFSFTGVLLALFISNTTLSVIAGLGAVLLIGIVVKNGIVLVDYINLMRDRGVALNEAIGISGKLRLRPVLMTALTTSMAMLPLALSTGEGSEIWSPMGVSLIGGLVFSTIVTLVLLPVLYAVFARRGERDRISRLRTKFTFMNDDSINAPNTKE